MTLMLKILGIIGWIILAILFLIVWIIIVPRHFYVEYSKRDSLIVKMNIAFFKLRLFPLPKFLGGESEEEKAQEQEQPETTVETPTVYEESVQIPEPEIKNQPEKKFDVSNSDEKVIKSDFETKEKEDKRISNVEKQQQVHENQNRNIDKKPEVLQKPIKTEKPSKPKHKKEKRPKKKKEPKEKIMLPEPFDDVELTFSLVKQIISAAKGVMKRILRAIKFSDISFTVPIYDEDPMRTQQKYAAATTGFYALSIFLQKNMQVYYKSPIFVADFANRHSESTYFYCKISASPILLMSAAYFAYKQFKLIMNNNKQAQTAPEKEK